jgi:hypothetical protein
LSGSGPSPLGGRSQAGPGKRTSEPHRGDEEPQGRDRRIAAVHPALGRHLGSTVRRGYRCGCVPDARRPVVWEL